MHKENLRSVAWEALKRNHRNQFAEIHAAIKEIAAEKGIAAESAEEFELAANELIWEFLTRGIIAPGGDRNHLDFRFLQLTDAGQQALALEMPPSEDDPGGYIARIAESVKRPLDAIVRLYIRESLATFLTGNYIAAMVMLSGAAERCLDLLIEEYAVVGDKSFENKIKRAGRSTRDRFETLRADIVRADLPDELADTLDIQLSGLFTLIRYARNDEGGPAGRSFDRDTAHAGLLLFPGYCKRVYDLVDFFLRSKAPKPEPVPETA